MAVVHRKKRASTEEGDPEAEKQQRQAEQKTRELCRSAQSMRLTSVGYDGEEYEALLRFVDDQSKQVKKGDDDDGEEEEAHYTRKWYAPWKKTKVESTSKKVSLYRLWD